MLEKLKQWLCQNDYNYEDVTRWYYKKIGDNNVSITIGNDFIDVTAYRGKSIRNMLTSIYLTERDLLEVINTIKEWEKWIQKK